MHFNPHPKQNLVTRFCLFLSSFLFRKSAWYHNYVWKLKKESESSANFGLSLVFWSAGRRWSCDNCSTRVWQLHPPPWDPAAVLEGGHRQLTGQVQAVWMPGPWARVSSSSVCGVMFIRVWGWLATILAPAAVKPWRSYLICLPPPGFREVPSNWNGTDIYTNRWTHTLALTHVLHACML